jgi:hypothetical protein
VSLFGAVGLVFCIFALGVLPKLRVEAREMLMATGALPSDPPEARAADVATVHPATPAGARNDLRNN